MPLANGTRLGDYEIVETLGSGGMGNVYRARDVKLAKTVALKVLNASAAASTEEDLARFEQEAHATSSLNHPHIVQVFDLGSTEHEGEELHFIAMEIVEGKSLRHLLSSPTPLPEILEILAQVGDALDKSHASGIVHRDIKPENILVTDDGYAKIVDFGIAKLIGSSERRAREIGLELDDLAKTQVGELMGTLAYMAPEQISGGDLDARADVFALGNIIYEAIAGDAPFRGDSAKTTVRNIVHNPVPEIRDPLRLAPLSLEAIARKCLAKEKEERYASTGEVSELLHAVIREMEDEPTKWVPVERMSASRLTTTVGFVVVALIIVILIILSLR